MKMKINSFTLQFIGGLIVSAGKKYYSEITEQHLSIQPRNLQP